MKSSEPKDDNEFADMMIQHHQAGIDMAKKALKFLKDPTLIKVAKNIINKQVVEIKVMKKVLNETN